MDRRVTEIMHRALDDQAPSKEDVIYLLGFKEYSPEATFIRAVGNDIARAKTDNTGIVFGQIGLELYPCECDCQFCAFGETHTGFTEKITLDDETIRQKVHDFTKDGDLYVLWLMTMNSFDPDYYLNAIRIAREVAPPQTQLYTNIGDTDYETFVKIREAGADGAYHVIRLGEGTYTTIDPELRRQTIANARRAGLALQECIEPIGPEHTPEIIADRMFEAIEAGVDTIGVMKRTPVPGTVFTTAITNARLAQVVGVNALAALHLPAYPVVPVHEADPVSLMSGANSICAETGVNPRDTAADTSAGRGLDVNACRQMMLDAGFTHLRRGDNSLVDLTDAYIAERSASE
jgi:biotin synthase